MLPVMLFCVFSPPNSRCGFAGETGPRFIIPSEIRKRGQQQVRRKSLFYLSTLYSVIIRSPLSWSLMVCCIISLSGNQSGSVQHKHRRALCHPKRVYPHSVLQVLYCMLFDSEFKKIKISGPSETFCKYFQSSDICWWTLATEGWSLSSPSSAHLTSERRSPRFSSNSLRYNLIENTCGNTPCNNSHLFSNFNVGYFTLHLYLSA